MPIGTSKTSICDRALQLLGMAAVSAVPQVGSRGAKAMERAYRPVLLSELQKNYWHFAIKRASLAASSTKPVHTKGNAYPLPADYLMLAPEDQDSDFPLKNDWIMEGGSIITDEDGLLAIRYVSSDITEPMFDATFAEALSAALAMEVCEELTNSNSKLSNLAAMYDEKIALARKRGFILIQKPRVPISPWISMRG